MHIKSLHISDKQGIHAKVNSESLFLFMSRTKFEINNEISWIIFDILAILSPSDFKKLYQDTMKAHVKALFHFFTWFLIFSSNSFLSKEYGFCFHADKKVSILLYSL